MNKINFKKETLTKAKAKVVSIITDLKKEMSNLKGSQRVIDGEQFDNTQLSQDEATYEVLDGLNTQLKFAQFELHTLEKLEAQNSLFTKVDFGSIVKTNHRTFYISVGIESFSVNGEDVFGISTKAPIYQEMRNRQKGDTFKFRNIDYEIKEVF